MTHVGIEQSDTVDGSPIGVAVVSQRANISLVALPEAKAFPLWFALNDLSHRAG